jgi:hypothetical protein
VTAATCSLHRPRYSILGMLKTLGLLVALAQGALGEVVYDALVIGGGPAGGTASLSDLNRNVWSNGSGADGKKGHNVRFSGVSVQSNARDT